MGVSVVRVASLVVVPGATAFFGTSLVGGLNPWAAGVVAAGAAVVCGSVEIFLQGRSALGWTALVLGVLMCLGIVVLPREMTLRHTCWNGRSTHDDRCTEPALQGGIEYVFPSFWSMKSCRQIDNRAESIRHDCRVDDALSIRYRYWRDLKLAMEHYERDRGADVRGDLIVDDVDFGTLQHGPDEKKQYLFTGIVGDGRFTFTVTSSSKSRGLEAVREMVRIRCPGDYRGYFGTGPRDCQVKI